MIPYNPTYSPLEQFLVGLAILGGAAVLLLAMYGLGKMIEWFQERMGGRRP